MAGTSWVVWAPLGTVAVWGLLAVYQVLRGRYRTWTEVFLIGACLSVVAYSLSDVAFFIADTRAAAWDAAVSSLICLTFSGLFFMLYGAVLQTRFRWGLFVSLFPVGAVVVLIPGTVLTDVIPSTSGVAWITKYDTAWFVVWISLLLAFVLIALVSIFLTYREVRGHSIPLARRLLALFVCLFLAVVLSLVTNTADSVFGWNVPPLLSTAFLVPGAVLLLAQTPLSERSLTDILRRLKARDYDVQGALMLHRDGTLIGSELVPGAEMTDQDVFAATMDVVQNFLRTSFPVLRGKWLQSIRQGDLTFVMERGQWTTVIVVLKGKENDQLRRYIQNRVGEFEARNGDALERWRGNPLDVVGLDGLFADIIR